MNADGPSPQQLPTAARSAQPRPSRGYAHPGMLTNADVLEVITEYACGTVADACALRGSCKGYRRAVDTTVRRLVYEDQPELRTSRSVLLRAHCGTDHLDAVRIAFTCDRFPKIARLVVVAFGLDGPKDELRDRDECGERPVAVTCTVEAVASEVASSCCPLATWISPIATRGGGGGERQAPRCERAVVSCLAEATVSAEDVANRETIDDDASVLWPMLRRLHVQNIVGGNGGTGDCPAVSRMLTDLAPQLTQLRLGTITVDTCGDIQKCTRLTRLHIDELVIPPAAVADEPVAGDGGSSCSVQRRLLDELSSALCGALIASGAPLESVCVNDMLAPAAMRLLDAVPTIEWIRTSRAGPALPRAAAFVALSATAAAADRGALTGVIDHLTPPGFVARLVVRADTPLRSPNIDELHPALDTLCLCGDGGFPAGDSSSIISELRFPPSLRAVLLDSEDDNGSGGGGGGDGSTAAAALVLQRLGVLGPSLLPNVRQVHLRGGAAGNIAPLVAFAHVLTSLSVLEVGVPDGRVLHIVEATLAQLVRLEAAKVASLPTARCFLGGRHTRLRELSVSAMNTPDAPFAALVRACPRLMYVAACEWAGAATLPPLGWCGEVAACECSGDGGFGQQQGSWNCLYLQRVSF